jgi:hypothetical protein
MVLVLFVVSVMFDALHIVRSKRQSAFSNIEEEAGSFLGPNLEFLIHIKDLEPPGNLP